MKIIRFFEIFFCVITVLLLAMWLLDIPGKSFLMIIFFSFLSFIYCLGTTLIVNNLFVKTGTPVPAKHVVMGIILGFAFSAIIIGALFKLMYWPNPEWTLMFGVVTSNVILVASAIFSAGEQHAFFRRALVRTAIIGGIGLLLLLVPQNTLIDFEYRKHPDYAKALKEYQADKSNKQLKEKLEEEGIKKNAPEHYERWKKSKEAREGNY